MVAERQRSFCYPRLDLSNSAMASPTSAMGPAGGDEEVRDVGAETEYEPVTAGEEPEVKARTALADSKFIKAASEVEEESACSHGGSNENTENESIGLAKSGEPKTSIKRTENKIRLLQNRPARV